MRLSTYIFTSLKSCVDHKTLCVAPEWSYTVLYHFAKLIHIGLILKAGFPTHNMKMKVRATASIFHSARYKFIASMPWNAASNLDGPTVAQS